MKSPGLLVSCLFALAVVAGCASTDASDRQILVTEQAPRPNHIWIYDFAATPDEVPPDSVLAGQPVQHPTPQTAEQIALSRQVGALITTHLIKEVRGMGLPAERGSSGTKPEINDIVVRGFLLSVDEGSAVKRVAVGFGSGGSALTVAAEGFQMTANGLRRTGSGTVRSGGDKTPGGAVGAVTLIATGNPVGLIVGGAAKGYGEYSGSSRIEGRAEAAAKTISDEMRRRFRQQGWIK